MLNLGSSLYIEIYDIYAFDCHKNINLSPNIIIYLLSEQILKSKKRLTVYESRLVKRTLKSKSRIYSLFHDKRHRQAIYILPGHLNWPLLFFVYTYMLCLYICIYIYVFLFFPALFLDEYLFSKFARLNFYLLNPLFMYVSLSL